MSVYINRPLNLKKIKAIGLDLDYTLVRYNHALFEKKTFDLSKTALVTAMGYPEDVLKFPFKFDQVIPGLVVDKKRGNLLKLSLFAKVKTAYHGTTLLTFDQQQSIYQDLVIDLNSPDIMSLDTNFSLSVGTLISYLVDLKDAKPNLKIPSYDVIAENVKHAVDLVHMDGSLKEHVLANLKEYVIEDPNVVLWLQRVKEDGKKILVITNSDYFYANAVLTHSITPYLAQGQHWSDLIDIFVSNSNKPQFFTGKNRFLKILPEKEGLLENYFGKIVSGMYQGGNAQQLQQDLGVRGSEILYLGDHIFGDVVTLKKSCNWRTALVVEQLAQEVEILKKVAPIQEAIDILMEKKETLEKKLNTYFIDRSLGKELVEKIFQDIDKINKEISGLIEKYNKSFNPNWGEMMRAGQEESRFAGQVEKYACIYMPKVSDLVEYSPRMYFRPYKRVLPHERLI